jgi:hypothetical protein
MAEKKKVVRKTLQQKIPEAVSSITYKMKTPQGFPVLFSMRGDDEGKLLERASETETFLKDAGYTPDVRGSKNDPATPAQKAVLVDKGVFKEGMTKAEASKVIGEVGKGKPNGNPFMPTESCPKCGSPLTEVTIKKGTPEEGILIKCSTAKWDPETKKESGCDYKVWPSN